MLTRQVVYSLVLTAIAATAAVGYSHGQEVRRVNYPRPNGGPNAEYEPAFQVSYSQKFAPEVFKFPESCDTEAEVEAAISRLRSYSNSLEGSWKLAVILVEQGWSRVNVPVSRRPPLPPGVTAPPLGPPGGGTITMDESLALPPTESERGQVYNPFTGPSLGESGEGTEGVVSLRKRTGEAGRPVAPSDEVYLVVEATGGGKQTLIGTYSDFEAAQRRAREVNLDPSRRAVVVTKPRGDVSQYVRESVLVQAPPINFVEVRQPRAQPDSPPANEGDVSPPEGGEGELVWLVWYDDFPTGGNLTREQAISGGRESKRLNPRTHIRVTEHRASRTMTIDAISRTPGVVILNLP